MDKIIVRTNAQTEAVMEWSKEYEGEPMMLAFPEGEIEFREEFSLLKFKDVGAPWVRFELWIHGTDNAEYARLVSWRTDLDEWKFEDVSVAGEGMAKVELSMMLSKYDILAKSVAKFCGIMMVAVHHREEVERTKVIERRVKPGKSRGKSGGRRMLTVRRYSLPEVLEHRKRKYTRPTESFGVRGHYRHYKSGKTVWVHPYTKGSGDRKDREFYL